MDKLAPPRWTPPGPALTAIPGRRPTPSLAPSAASLTATILSRNMGRGRGVANGSRGRKVQHGRGQKQTRHETSTSLKGTPFFAERVRSKVRARVGRLGLGRLGLRLCFLPTRSLPLLGWHSPAPRVALPTLSERGLAHGI